MCTVVLFVISSDFAFSNPRNQESLSDSSRVISRSYIKSKGRSLYHIMIITMRSLCTVKYKVLYMLNCGHAFSLTPSTPFLSFWSAIAVIRCVCVCVLTVIKTIKMYIAAATTSWWRDNMVANQQTGSLKGCITSSSLILVTVRQGFSVSKRAES